MSIFSELQRRNVLRVAAAYLVVGWLLTEVLTTILPTLGAPEWVAKAVILSFAFGFIPAVVLSWVYELTPDGIKKESELDRDAGDGATSSGSIGKLDYLTITGVVVAIVFIAFFSASRTPDSSPTNLAAFSNESVAVLPFVNMSNDEDNEYFSDGLTETLLHMLAQIPDLKVAARTSSFAFKGKNMDIREIANALQVAHILEGSVQQSGNRVRITAQLIRASDGYHVWSENFDRDSDDIFGIQDEIASKVGKALSASLLGNGSDTMLAGVGTDDADAYDLYLQALQQRATFSYGGLEAAEELLKGALTIDPNFLDAKTELASNYLHQLETGLMNRDDAFRSAQAMINQVLVVDPDNVGSLAIQSYVRSAQSLRSGEPTAVEQAIEEVRVLVEANPREYEARLLLSKMLQGTQQTDEAMALQKAALEIDPYNPRILFEIGSLYLERDEIDAARTSLRASLDIEPRQPNAYLKLGMIALKAGDGVDYLRQSLKAMQVDSRDHEIPGFIAEFLYSLGLFEEADDFRDRVLAIAPTSPSAYRIELLRAIALQDEVASDAAARRAIEDGVEDRQFAYGGAAQYLLRKAARTGTVDEESAYLDGYEPGILDIDAETVPARFLAVQGVAFDAWYQTLPRDELMRRIARIQTIAASYGVDMQKNPESRMAVMAMQGNTSDAVDIALAEVFTKPVILDQDWRERYSLPQYADLIADPRVQAALEDWENEEEAVRDRVRSFLMDLSSAS